MLDKYYTVKNEKSNQLIIQKSRFIGYVKRVESEESALRFIEKIKKKHYDATHNCSAYIIGENDQIQKANDDGEPSGTAGIPMLEVLKKQKLKDTAVVVTRYFGGIKLGAGGLIRAYGSTTSEVLKVAGIVKRQLMQGMAITVDYTILGKLENELRQSAHILDSIDYSDQVEFLVYVKRNDVQDFREWIVDLTNGTATLAEKKVAYSEIDITSHKKE